MACRRNLVRTAGLMGLLGVLAGCALFPDASIVENRRKRAVKTPAKTAFYSKYRFGTTDKVIDFGTQPLAVPEGVINEVMSRDLILRRELARRGFSIRIHPFLKGGDMNRYFIRGDIEVAFAGDMPAITAAATSKVRILGLAKQGFSTIVARRKWLVSELKGRRIGYVAGSTDHYALLKALLDYGLRPADVKLVPVELDEMPDAIRSGRIDALSAREPIPTIVLSHSGEYIPIHRMLNTAYCYMPQRFTERHPDESRLILAAFARAVNWLRARDDNLRMACGWTLETGERFTGRRQALSPRQMAEIVKRDLLNISGVPLIPHSVFDDNGYIFQEYMFLASLNKAPVHTPWTRIKESFDPGCLREIMTQPDRYQLTTFDYQSEG